MGDIVNGQNGGVLVGDSHDEPSGGIPAHVTSTGEDVLLEGGEVIINKTNIASEKEYTVTGTPKEIASAINSVDGNGVVIENGAEMTNLQTGETKIMEKGGLIPDGTFDLLWFLHLKFDKE